MAQAQPNILELIAQLASLQKSLTPALPAVSQKLVADQIATGADVRKLAKVIGRAPGFIRQVAAGQKSLSAQGIVDLLKHITAERTNADKA